MSGGNPEARGVGQEGPDGTGVQEAGLPSDYIRGARKEVFGVTPKRLT